MPRRSVHGIFNEFVAALGTLIKERVAESVRTATADLLASKFMAGQAEELKQVRRRRKGKKPSRKPGPPPTVSRKLRRGGVTSPKPVKLSKNGKRIGRPPEVLGEWR